MKLRKKHIIIGSIAAIGLSFMGFVSAKSSQAKEVFKKMVLKISSISRIRIENSKLKFNVDLALQNVTSQDFTLSTSGIIKGKIYRIYRNEKLIAVGSLNDIQGVNLPAGSVHVFKNITVELGLIDLVKELTSTIGKGNVFEGLKTFFEKGAIDKIKSIQWASILKELSYEIDIEAMGQIYTFKEKL